MMSLQKVVPYHHTNTLFVKGRWLNRTILDVVVDEFKTRDRDFHLRQIALQRLKIERDNKIIAGDELLSLRLQNKDILHLTVHKHEPPVLALPVDTVYESEELVVVNKPPSIPVHPTGRYYYNSLTEMLKPKYGELYLCHRLDKLTSGIVILARNPQMAASLQREIRSKQVEKFYLARVQGEFPGDENGIVCNRPVANIDTKLGFQHAMKEKKEASTRFTRISYCPELNQSVVLCQPTTGRTHQIRIHLNMLGFPIVNDPLYGPASSPLRRQLLISEAPMTKEQFDTLLKEDRDKIERLSVTGRCVECGELLFADSNPESMVIWLHAFRYKFKDKEFITRTPSWCDYL